MPAAAITGTQYTAALVAPATDAPAVLATRPTELLASWSTGSTRGVTVAQIDPYAVVRTNPVVDAALRPYRYLRADATVTVRVSANRFLYGRLIVAWAPYNPAGYGSGITPSGYYATSAVSMPHVVLDANTDEPVEIRIPYYGALPSVDMRRDVVAPLGLVYIFVYDPLTAVSTTPTTSVPVTYTVSLANVVLDAPTP